MKTHLIKKFMIAFTAVCMMVVTVPTMQVQAADTYTITYSTGNMGTFTDSYINQFGSTAKETANGNLNITVKAGDAYPVLPQAQDIEYKNADDASAYYVLTDGWQPTATKVTKNESYVMQYSRLIDGVLYTIEYVDASSGLQVATPGLAYGEAGKPVAIPTALTIPNYRLTSAPTKEITLDTDPAKNVYTFTYTSTLSGGTVTNEVYTYTDGGTVTTYETVDNIIIQPVAVAGGGAGGAGAPAEETTEIPDEETPLAPGADEDAATTEDNANTEETTVIADEDTALAAPGNATTPNVVVVAAGIIGGVAIILAGTWLVVRRRRTVENTNDDSNN